MRLQGWAVGLVLGLGVVLGACRQGPQTPASSFPSPAPGEGPPAVLPATPAPTPTPTLGDSGSLPTPTAVLTPSVPERPSDGLPETLARPADLFSPESPFNRPIPPDAPVDPRSDALIRAFAEAGREHGFNLSVRAFSVPVYFAGSGTPRREVRLSAEWAPWQSLGPVPIPPQAKPDPEDDGHLAVVDRSGGCIYEFWQARQVGDRWVASWGNALSLGGDGFYPQGGGARAGGSSLVAGLLWPEELRRGEIRHALVFAYGKTRSGGPVPPATASDGWSPDPDALPEGALLQLDPAFDVETLPRWQRPIARALQTYGMYLMDTTGGDIALYAVNPVGLARDPYDDLIPPSAWRGDRPGARDWATLDIPPERFRVLRMEPQRPNPSEPTPPACGERRGGWREGVWGVAVEEGIAYLAGGVDGLQVVDLRDPAAPRLLATFAPDEMEAAVAVRVEGARAYVGTVGSGLWVVDVSDPARPTALGRFGVEEEHTFTALALRGSTLYLADEGVFYAVDLTDPHRPRLLGLLEDPDRIAEPQDLALWGDLALLADRDLGLVVLDVADPSRPRWVGIWEDYGEGVVPGQGSVYLLNHTPGLRVLDLTDPQKPGERGSASLPDFAYRGVRAGPWLYLAGGLGGLQVVDVGDPASPEAAGEVKDLPGYARDLAVEGGRAYLALQDGGLAVVDIHDPTRPRTVVVHPPFRP